MPEMKWHAKQTTRGTRQQRIELKILLPSQRIPAQQLRGVHERPRWTTLAPSVPNKSRQPTLALNCGDDRTYISQTADADSYKKIEIIHKDVSKMLLTAAQ